MNMQELTFQIEQLYRAIGLLGVGLYVLSFYLLSTGRLDCRAVPYFALNLGAALSVLVSLVADFNLSSALIQGFYAVISLMAISIRVRRLAPRPAA